MVVKLHVTDQLSSAVVDTQQGISVVHKGNGKTAADVNNARIILLFGKYFYPVFFAWFVQFYRYDAPFGCLKIGGKVEMLPSLPTNGRQPLPVKDAQTGVLA